MDSRTELSLLEPLKGGGLAASVVATFNAYLPFYEHVVLPKLRAAGSRHNIVLMDASECSKAMAQPDTAARLAGRAYTLVPIESGGAFHPKMLLLLGKAKAALYVGSHNLTLSGFGRNAELTGLVAASGKEVAGSAEIGTAWAAVRGWVRREGERLPEDVHSAISAVEHLVPWLGQARLARSPSTASRLLVQSREGASTWQQLLPLLPSKVSAVSVVGAFFDARLAFLAELQRLLPSGTLRVVIQPQTVSLPCDAKLAAAYDWRDGSAFAEAGGYLHAKAVWIQARDGEDLLLVGSANPSAPAWLAAAASRNDEAMLVLRGHDAQQAAHDLELARIGELPRIKQEVLRDIAGRDTMPAEDAREHRRPRVGALEDRELSLSAAGLSRTPSRALFVDSAGRTFAEATDIRRAEGWLLIKVPDDLPLGQMASVRLHVPGEADIVVIVHRTAEIADLCRGGAQQALRAALEGLDDDSHDIAELVSIVEKAIFTDVTAELPEKIGAGRVTTAAGMDKEKPGAQRPETLVVPAKEMKHRHARRRLLRPGSDLADLLDMLFRELRIDRAKRDVDQHGRSEEEQVGQDDDFAPAVLTGDAAMAKLCRSKAARLVKRAVRYVEQAGGATEPRQWLDAIVKLTAVLALLRELRVIEQLPRWRTAHQRLVDPESLDSLLEGVMPALFGRETALLWRTQAALGDESYEELARLKGLLLWLAWDCRVALQDRYSQMDEPEVLRAKLWAKAALLEIAKYLPGDDLALHEAHQSVMRCASPAERVSAAQWIQDVSTWCSQIEDLLLRGRGRSKPITEAQVGELAYVTSSGNVHVRVISRKEADVIALCDLGAEHGRISYAANRVMGVELAGASR